MSRFEDLVNQQLSQAREAQAHRDQVARDMAAAQAQSEQEFIDSVTTEFQQDPRKSRLEEFLSNPQLRDAISYMFKKLTKGDENDFSPRFSTPHFSKNELIVERKKPGFSIRKFIDDHMVGSISFDAGYYIYSTISSEHPDANSAYSGSFRFLTKINNDGQTMIEIDDEEGLKRQNEPQIIYRGRELAAQPNPWYKAPTWLPVNNINETLEHIAGWFTKKIT